MHYADIYALLVKKGITLSQVAEAEDVDPSLVSKVIRNSRRSYAVASFIAAKTGVPLERLWPGVYTYSPRERGRDRNYNRVAA